MVWHNDYQVWLTEEQSLHNAQLIVDQLYSSSDWSKESLSAMIGNMRHESSVNPNMYEFGYEWVDDRGFGLVQWTPRSKYWNWAISNGYDESTLREGDAQIARIQYEVENNIQYLANGHQVRYGEGEKYNFSFADFRTNQPNLSVHQLTEAFMWNYEGPNYQAGQGSLSDRQGFANRVFTELKWSNGGGGGDVPDSQFKQNVKKDLYQLGVSDYFTNGTITIMKQLDNSFKVFLNGGVTPPVTGNPVFPTLEGLPITSGYGWRPPPTEGASEYHWAIDIGNGGNVDPPVKATQDGEVIGNYWTEYGGWTVRIKHTGDSYYSQYQHMKEQSSVIVGSSVGKGDVIGIMGTTGASTGVHLDFAISINGTFYTEEDTINPVTYLGI